jgi:hypothetical protein
LFGSVLREDFNDNRDIDILVTFQKNALLSLFDMFDLQGNLDGKNMAHFHKSYRRVIIKYFQLSITSLLKLNKGEDLFSSE